MSLLVWGEPRQDGVVAGFLREYADGELLSRPLRLELAAAFLRPSYSQLHTIPTLPPRTSALWQHYEARLSQPGTVRD